jgi:1-deoxy-D-xylulose-5-phosphate synthase
VATILEKIDSPADLKGLNGCELEQLAADIREEIVKVVSQNGGHLASSLGVVELTLALHRTFNSPHDKIIWDVGHQSYAHKLLTGRRERFATLRQYGGLSGFPAPWESPYDAFVGGHSGNSISAALGMAIAGELAQEKLQVVAVIGDGSLGAGMALEAVNHAGHLGKKLIVVLNDNGMSISPSVGALSRLLSQVRVDSRYNRAKLTYRNILNRLPMGKSTWNLSMNIKKRLKRVLLPNAFWEEMGFLYLGPLDGHNIADMEKTMVRAREIDSRPVVIHVLTQKGKGSVEAESDVVKYHGLAPAGNSAGPGPSYSQVLGQTVLRLMKENEKVVVISAAMLDGTGLARAAAEYPQRVFDVGICEQHAVTLAAGLASQGFIPVVAVYSTFLQRAYDQIIHDVCLPGLGVIFAIDRAGIVGEDGKTHQGSFDISFLRCLPNMILASPADENELQNMLCSAVKYRRPAAIRYPRGCGRGTPQEATSQDIQIGKGRVLRDGADLTMLTLGPMAYSALEAARILEKEGLNCSVINCRFAKPLDEDLILGEAEKTHNILTIEENSLYGGFGGGVLELLSNRNIYNIKVKCLGLPDSFISHGPQELMRSLSNLDPEGIAQTARNIFSEPGSSSSMKIQEEA